MKKTVERRKEWVRKQVKTGKVERTTYVFVSFGLARSDTQFA